MSDEKGRLPAQERDLGLNESEDVELPEWMSLTSDRIRSIFESLDSDCDGRVSFSELSESLGRYGLPTQGIETLCRRLDGDRSEDLDAAEFGAAVRSLMIELLYSGSWDAEAEGIAAVEYSGPSLETRTVEGRDAARKLIEEVAVPWADHGAQEQAAAGVRWFHVRGRTALQCAAILFGIHPVAVEDALSPQQRPKVERYEDHVLFVVPRLQLADTRASAAQADERLQRFSSTNVCIFVDTTLFRDVITFTLDQEEEDQETGWRSVVSSRLAKSYTRLRESDAQFLAYTILDALVDSARPVVRTFRGALLAERDAMRAARYARPRANLNQLDRDLARFARLVKPVHRVLATIIDDDRVLKDVLFYLRDVYDDLQDLDEDLATFAAESTAIHTEIEKFFQSKMDNALNLLAIITAIFLPLQFATGVFGMNLHIPEANYKYAYHLFWLLSVIYVIVAAFTLRLSAAQLFSNQARTSDIGI